jgi:alkylation response protein AidB-like acyl-CoA dehydrogenase
MTSPGSERRPFPELSDPNFCDFNEVFFNDVRVPASHLVGSLHGGWPITQGSLAHERAMLWIQYAYDVARVVDALVALGDRPTPEGGRLGDDARFRDAVAGFHVDAQALLTMGYTGFSKFLHGKSSPEHSLLKLFGSETLQRALLFGAESVGPDAVDADVFGPRMWREGSWAIQWLRSFGATIPGGTSEVQRNIIAERVLGLPRA